MIFIAISLTVTSPSCYSRVICAIAQGSRRRKNLYFEIYEQLSFDRDVNYDKPYLIMISRIWQEEHQNLKIRKPIAIDCYFEAIL